MALLEVKHLTKHFGGLTAVGDVTLELDKGELVGVVCRERAAGVRF